MSDPANPDIAAQLRAAQEQIARLERENRTMRALLDSGPQDPLEGVVATLGMAALAGVEPDPFCTRVCSTVADALGVEAVALWEVQPGNLSITPRSGHGVPGQLIGRLSGPTVGGSHVARALVAPQPLAFPIARASAESGERADRWLQRAGYACGLAAGVGPMSRRIGVLAVYTEHERRFSGHEHSFLADVAEVVGRAAEHGEESLHLRLRNRVSSVLATSGTVADAAEPLLSAVAELLDLNLAEVWVPEEASDGATRLQRAAVHLAPGDGEGDSGPRVMGEAEALFETLTAQAWRTGTLQWMGGGTVPPESDVTELPPLRGLAVPILAGLECLGVLSFFTRNPLFPKYCTRRALHEAGLSAGEFMRWARAEEALRESEESLRQALRMAPFPLIISREGAAPLLINDRFYQVTGIAPEYLEGNRTWYQAVALKPVRHAGEESWDSGIRSGGLLNDGEYTVRTAAGELRRWEIRSAHLGRGADGRRLRISLVNDVTETRELQAEREQHDRMKDEFLAVLGHELRNPLAAIQTAVGLLARSGGREREIERIGEVLGRQSAKMVKLVDGLFDVSRIDKGKFVLQPTVFDFRLVVQSTIELLRPRAEQRRHVLVVRGGETPLWVDGDRERLEQVCDNLLTNAIKFTPPGGTLRVEMARRGDHLELRVEDNGVGFDEAVQSYLFTSFRQAPQAPDREAGGLGLGLSLVRGLVELHGGSIEGRSEGPGKGAVFEVTLPLTDSAPLPERDSGDHGEIGPARRVLLVEDNVDFATLLCDALSLTGHEVRVVGDGEAALTVAREVRPDFVLCDIGLPGELTGYDVARALRAEAALGETTVVALTGYGRPEDVARALSAGFDAHLTKPVDLETLERLMSRGAGRG